MENKLTYIKLEKNGAEFAFEIKIIVLILQRAREVMPPYIIINRRPQTYYKINNFINVVQYAYTNACEGLEDMRFLNSAVYGLPC